MLENGSTDSISYVLSLYDNLDHFHPCVIFSTQITRKVIRKYVSADGVEREEVMLEGQQQEAVTVDEADGFSKVVKRTVVQSGGEQTEV